MALAGSLAANAPLIAFASVLAGSLGIPVPTLAAVIYVGSLLAQRQGGPGVVALVFAAAMVGAVIGDAAWFFAGRRFGTRILGLICRLSLSRDSCVRRTSNSFARHGVFVLLFARFVPGLSLMTAPLAGLSGTGLGRFLGFAETGAALWIGTGLAVGYVLATQVVAVLAGFQRFGLDLGGAAIVLALGYAGVSWFRRRQLIQQLRGNRISVDELAVLVRRNPATTIIDARSPVEHGADPFTIPGAVTLPPISPGPDHVVVFCSCPNEIAAALIAADLRRRGFANVLSLVGGLEAWRERRHPVAPIAVEIHSRDTKTRAPALLSPG